MAKPLPVAPTANVVTTAPPMPAAAPRPVAPAAPQPVATPAGAWPQDMQQGITDPDTVEGQFVQPVHPVAPLANAVPGVNVAGFAGGLNTAMNKAVQQQAKATDANKRPGDANAGMALLRGIDFSQVADAGRLLPTHDRAGQPIDYEAEVISAEWRTGDDGSQNVALELKTTFPVADAGITIFDNISLKEKAQWKAKSLMRATETLSEDGTTPLMAGIDEWEGHIVRFRITHEEYTNPRTQKTYTNNRIEGSYSPAYLTPSLNMTAPPADATPNPQGLQ